MCPPPRLPATLFEDRANMDIGGWSAKGRAELAWRRPQRGSTNCGEPFERSGQPTRHAFDPTSHLSVLLLGQLVSTHLFRGKNREDPADSCHCSFCCCGYRSGRGEISGLVAQNDDQRSSNEFPSLQIHRRPEQSASDRRAEFH